MSTSLLSAVRASFLSLSLAALLLLVPVPAQAQVPIPAPPSVNASSFILVDFHSDRVLAERESDARIEPASIVKLMTSFVAFREIAAGNLALDDEVLISERAWRTPGSRMFVEVGRRVRVEDLLQGIIIQSGNDASVALAEHIAGDEAVFATMMNQVAASLGMTGTHYTNATGLPDPDQFTTARDTAKLARAIISGFPQFYGWYSQREFTFADIRQHNRNRLLWRDPSVDGLKTGHTSTAGFGLVTSASREGMRLISVVMGSSTEEARLTGSQALLNYGFRFFETFQLYDGQVELGRERVWRGRDRELALGLEEALFVTVQRGRYDALQAHLELDDRLQAPIATGDALGRLVISLDGTEVATRPLIALADVEPAGLLGRTGDGIRMWLDGLFGSG